MASDSTSQRTAAVPASAVRLSLERQVSQERRERLGDRQQQVHPQVEAASGIDGQVLKTQSQVVAQ